MDQALHLRGSRDFGNRDDYARFLQEVVAVRNADRGERHAAERAALRPLPAQRQDSCLRLPVRVDPGSLIHIHRNTYSVHSRLIGQQVEAWLYAERVEVWYAGIQVDTLPRLVGRDKHAINYRHIIDQLVRKPGAFDNYRYREDLFPNSRFRMAYDRLQEEHAPDVARRAYLRILQHAARDSESAVDDALRFLLAQEQPLSAENVIALARTSTQLPAPTAERATREGLSYPQYLAELASRECQTRNHSRVQRLLRNARLLQGKTWDQFHWPRVPLQVARQLQSLRDGTFLDRRENLLVFGKPGSGPRGNGGAVHLIGGTIRARQRSLDQQLAVLAMGTDLQGPDDHRRGHRSLGASQRDHRIEHSQLSLGDRQEHAENIRPGDPRAYDSLTPGIWDIPSGNLIVAKEEI